MLSEFRISCSRCTYPMAAAVQCAASQAWPRYSQRKLPGQQCRACLGGLTYLPSSECPLLSVDVKDTDIGFGSRSPRLHSRSRSAVMLFTALQDSKADQFFVPLKSPHVLHLLNDCPFKPSPRWMRL